MIRTSKAIVMWVALAAAQVLQSFLPGDARALSFALPDYSNIVLAQALNYDIFLNSERFAVVTALDSPDVSSTLQIDSIVASSSFSGVFDLQGMVSIGAVRPLPKPGGTDPWPLATATSYFGYDTSSALGYVKPLPKPGGTDPGFGFAAMYLSFLEPVDVSGMTLDFALDFAPQIGDKIAVFETAVRGGIRGTPELAGALANGWTFVDPWVVELTLDGAGNVLLDEGGNPIPMDGTGREVAWLEYTGTPVPEPSTMILLGSGLVSLAGASRRRRAKSGN